MTPTPKEKAQDLFDKYLNFQVYTIGFKPDEFVRRQRAKECALISVDEIINAIGIKCSECQDEQNKQLDYWQEVKQEIEKL